jgi:hypothetical protein
MKPEPIWRRYARFFRPTWVQTSTTRAHVEERARELEPGH